MKPKHLKTVAAKGKGYSMQAADKGVGEIFLYDDIGDSWDGTTAKSFAEDLKGLGELRTLNVFINSPGGYVFDGVAIYNQLKRHKARKVVQIDGIAASIASVIAMAGDEIAIAANGMMMIHDPWAFAFGTAAEMRKMADSLDKVRDSILGTYVRRTGADGERIEAMMAEETWFDAEDALELGFADKITEEVAIAAKARGFDLSKFRNAPAELVKAAGEADETPAAPEAPPPDDEELRLRQARQRHRLQRRNLDRRASPADVAAG